MAALVLVVAVALGLSGYVAIGNALSGTTLSRESRLYVVSADGGELRQLRDAGESYAWSPDSRRIAYGSRCGLALINLDGSGRQALLRRRKQCPTAVSWSPRGNRIAFAAQAGDPGTTTIETITPSGSHGRRIDRFYDERGVDHEDRPVWSPSGERLLYVRFVALPAKKEQLVTPSRRDIVSVHADGRAVRRIAVGVFPRWSPDGHRIAFIRRERVVVVSARGGTERPVVARLVYVDAPVWSPAGRQIAFNGVTVKGDRRHHVFVVDAGGGRPRQLTGEVQVTTPVWSPDGARIAYADYEGQVRVVAPDGSAERTLSQLPDAEITALSWSPDGRRLAFAARKRPPEN